MSSEDIRDSADAANDVTEGMGRLNTTDGEPKTEEDYQQAQLTVRAIVTSREAGVIIGKGGQNVADLRDATGVKAGVSKVVPGVHDRVFSVTGSLEQISKAYARVAQSLLEGAPSMGMGGIVSTAGTHRKLTLFLMKVSSASSLRRRRNRFSHLLKCSQAMLTTCLYQLYACSFRTTKWAPSSAAKVLRLSKFKMLLEFAW